VGSTHDFVAFLAPRLIACFGDPNGELERLVGTWIAYTVRFAPRYEVEYVDVGYDCSARVNPTNEVLRTVPLTTVEDFLEQPNGQTVATYESGAGLGASSYSDDLSEQVGDAVYAMVLKLIADAPEPVRVAFEAADGGYGDIVDCDAVAEAIVRWECELASRPIAPILEAFEFAARRRRQMEEEREVAAGRASRPASARCALGRTAASKRTATSRGIVSTGLVGGMS
jgi:hypothetical protein